MPRSGRKRRRDAKEGGKNTKFRHQFNRASCFRTKERMKEERIKGG